MTQSDEEPPPLVPVVGSSTYITEKDVEELLAKIEAEASNKERNYAAGMRHARTIVERELKEKIK